jgi:uncharacterized membrane protein YvbJ
VKYCGQCGNAIEEEDKFCRICGTALKNAPTPFRGPAMLTPENAAGYWKNFFGPFFKTAFIFFACFFCVSLLFVVIWFLMFRY